jgi:hypothetical protein
MAEKAQIVELMTAQLADTLGLDVPRAAVVAALIDAANAAGGKDNITVVYVQGPDFPDRIRTGDTLPFTPTPQLGDTRVPTSGRPAATRETAWRRLGSVIRRMLSFAASPGR